MGKGKIVQLGCNESSYEALRKLQSDGYDVVAALGSRDKLAEIKKNVGDSVEVCDEHFRDVVLAVTKPDVCIVENGNYETLLSCTRNGVSTVYVGTQSGKRLPRNRFDKAPGGLSQILP